MWPFIMYCFLLCLSGSSDSFIMIRLIALAICLVMFIDATKSIPSHEEDLDKRYHEAVESLTMVKRISQAEVMIIHHIFLNRTIEWTVVHPVKPKIRYLLWRYEESVQSYKKAYLYDLRALGLEELLPCYPPFSFGPGKQTKIWFFIL